MSAPATAVAAGRTTSSRLAAVVGTVPAKHRAAVQKSLRGALPPRQAIRVKCLDCCHFDRAEVPACAVVLCPLWAVRPYRKAAPKGSA